MSQKKIIGLSFAFIILLIIIFVGYISINYIYQEFILRKEINELIKLDITKDKFNERIITHGDYKIVEKSIKDYLDSYASSLQNIGNIVNDKKLKNLLSYDSLKDTDVNESINYVKNIKNDFNSYVDKLVYMCSKDNIEKNITKNKLNTYYYNLYNDLMFNDDVITKLNLSVDYLENYRQRFNIKLDTCVELFNFLKDNADNYNFLDGEIKFATQELIDQYNKYIEKINN